MTKRVNDLGQPIGEAVPGWTPPPFPPRASMEGRFCRLEPLDPDRHGESLFAAYQEDRTGQGWTYLSYGPFGRPQDFRDKLTEMCRSYDRDGHAVIDLASGRAVGMASYLRIDPDAGSIEVGSIHYAPRLQRTAAATEAMYLMMRRAFDELGYRRYEWKCDVLNAPSRRAALRLGFAFEGIFRQAVVYKGRNRDTAWYSIVDIEWPAIRAGFEHWLRLENFDSTGRQREPLSRSDRHRPDMA